MEIHKWKKKKTAAAKRLEGRKKKVSGDEGRTEAHGKVEKEVYRTSPMEIE